MIKLRHLSIYSFLQTKKMKIYKKPLYQAIPAYHKPHYIDIHDGYKYRTRQQVMQQLSTLKIKAQIIKHTYADVDLHGFIKDRKAIIQIDVNSLNLTHLQEQRFKLLMGPRYNVEKKIAKIVCQMYPDYDQNIEKLLEQVQEVVLESKRAP